MQDAIAKTNPRITTIINPNAANKKWKRNVLVRTYLQKHLPGDVVDTHKDKAFTVQTAKELCAHNDVIVAAGGDGTIADVIQGVIRFRPGGSDKFGYSPPGKRQCPAHFLRNTAESSARDQDH